MTRFWQDLRYALRVLSKDPTSTAAAVLALALGTGINTALFTFYNAIALRPLPVKDPGSVVRIIRSLESRGSGDVQYLFSYPEYAFYRGHNRHFSSLAAYTPPASVAAAVEHS